MATKGLKHLRKSSISKFRKPVSIFNSVTITRCVKRYLIPLFTLFIILIYLFRDYYGASTDGTVLNKLLIKFSFGGIKADPWKTVGKSIDLKQNLEIRLKDWENSPLFDANSPEWIMQNAKSCPLNRMTPNQNPGLREHFNELWHTINVQKITELRTDMIAFLRESSSKGMMSKQSWGVGKGITTAAGNADTFSRVLTTVKLLRKHLNTTLPVEIFSFPGEVPTDEVRKELEGLGVKLVVVEHAVKDSGSKSYHIKATAIIKSSFREVLYLDSDNLPVADLSPTDSNDSQISNIVSLWNSRAYKRLGVMFWPDYWRTGADNPIWSILGVSCRDEWEQESGQILIDKALHLDALLLTEWMLATSRFKFWMSFSDGDKDLFRFAFLALRKRWGVPGRYVGVGSFPSDTASGYGGHTMIQHDHFGRPIFIHANMLKKIHPTWVNGKGWGRTKSLSLPSSSKILPPSSIFPPTSPFDSESDSNLVDHDVDCDQLANSDYNGISIGSASLAIRRRAAMERGVKVQWHGGDDLSPAGLDMIYKDTRTLKELNQQRLLLPKTHHLSISSKSNLPSLDPTSPQTLTAVEIEALSTLMKNTKLKDGTDMYWGKEDGLVIRNWSDDPRLKDFEKLFLEEGGLHTGEGFA